MSKRIIDSQRAASSPTALSLFLVSLLALGAAFVGRSNGSAREKEPSGSASMHLTTAHFETL
ncbi:MAG: hypothetical protein ACKO0N_07585, partial [Planctomycetota bacterium]